MKILILEDSKFRNRIFQSKLAQHSLVTCIDAQTAIDVLKEEEFDLIFLDHDLGGEEYVSTTHENTGSAVVRSMIEGEHVSHDPPIIIHSLNHSAAVDMKSKLEAFGHTKVYQISFLELNDRYLDDPLFLTSHES